MQQFISTQEFDGKCVWLAVESVNQALPEIPNTRDALSKPVPHNSRSWQSQSTGCPIRSTEKESTAIPRPFIINSIRRNLRDGPFGLDIFTNRTAWGLRMRNQRLEQLKSIHMGVNPKIGVFTPQNGWFMRENPISLMIWGYPYFWKHPYGIVFHFKENCLVRICMKATKLDLQTLKKQILQCIPQINPKLIPLAS